MTVRQTAPPSARELRISEIRILALAEIHLGGTGIDARAYHSELETLKRRPLSVAWLEANIQMCFIAHHRPARTVMHLAKLRERRETAGQPELFEAFDAKLRAYLLPLRLTNHSYSTTSFADIDHAPVWATVDKHSTALRDLGYEAFLNSGTLLGVVRDGALIAHDDDVDLAVVLRANTPQDAAAEWLSLQTTLAAHDLVEPDLSTDPAICKLRSAGTTQVDLFPAWRQDGKLFVYPYLHGEADEATVFPLQACGLTGQSLPAQPEQMLEHNYGAGWRHPDPLYKFPWDNAKARFAPFLERLHTPC